MHSSRLLISCILFVLLGLTGCGSDDNSVTDGDQSTTDGDAVDGDDPDGDLIDSDLPDGDLSESLIDGDGDELSADGDADLEGFENELEIDLPPNPIEEFIQEVDLKLYTDDLTFIAAERVPGSEHWQAVQDLCNTRLTDLGYTMERHEYDSGVNIIGRKQGSDANGGEVILSAHYDHIPGCAGADDNASGVAALLEAARVMAEKNFKNTLVLACWDEEETGLKGSIAYADRAKEEGATIISSMVFETMAYTDDAPDSQFLPWGFDLIWPDMAEWLTEREFRGDFIAVIADESASASNDALEFYAKIIDLPLYVLELDESQKTSDVFHDLRRSDHDAFWRHDMPALMLTDTANFRNPYYHCSEGPDTVDTLNIPFAVEVTKATIGAAMDLLEVVE